MKKFLSVICVSMIIFSASGQGFHLKIVDKQPVFFIDNNAIIAPANEGLWSIATAWEKDWPTKWHHASATRVEKSGHWQILCGTLELPEGNFELRDAYLPEGTRIKCIRRFEWKGEQALEKATLSVRWKIDAPKAQTFLPGIVYYGNPSGEMSSKSGTKSGTHRVPVYHGKAGEKAIFEEHRYAMPFASLEWDKDGSYEGAALHAKPSPVTGGNIADQWWSLGVQAFDNHSELVMLSGPIAYNMKLSVAKAHQGMDESYGDTWTKIKPGAIIEKTFYLEAYEVAAKGSGFQRPVHTSIDIFKPFYVEDFPTYNEIIQEKYRFAKSRYIQTPDYAGFSMYPDEKQKQKKIVMGWAGQAEAPIYALQVLQDKLGDPNIPEMVQKSADHLCTSTIGENGFKVRYNTDTKEWQSNDPVSEGQAMNSIAMAIKQGRKNKAFDTKQLEAFLKKALDTHLKRVSDPAWSPRNTAEAFYISPFLIGSELFKNKEYKKTALAIADYYAARHLSMEEPYWGGTLDAKCEDKEGAWGAFQGFMTAYEYTKDKKYLDYAQHASDVVLSYSIVWDIPFFRGRLADHGLKTRGWTIVSPQNQHIDVYGVLEAPMLYKLGQYTNNYNLKRFAITMYRSCGQMIDPYGSQGEQLLQTNFAQHGDRSNMYTFRGRYLESWTVFWITAHFLHAAAQFEEMGVEL